MYKTSARFKPGITQPAPVPEAVKQASPVSVPRTMIVLASCTKPGPVPEATMEAVHVPEAAVEAVPVPEASMEAVHVL